MKQHRKKFLLIENESVNVIVNWGNSMKLVEDLKEVGYTYSLMKQLTKFTVGIRCSDFNRLVEYGAVEEILKDIYVLTDREQYDCYTGLSLDNHWIEEILMV